jgi:membrane-bound lytic murein transglycosylase B
MTMQWGLGVVAALAAAGCATVRAQETESTPVPTQERYRFAEVRERPEIADLVARVAEASGSGDGKLPAVPKERVLEVLADPRAAVVYWEKLVDVLEPSFPSRAAARHEEYFKSLLEGGQVAKGVEFARGHEPALAAAEATYKVPRWDVVSILMAETRLGTRTGDYTVLNTLTTVLLFSEAALGEAEARFRRAREGEEGVEEQIARNRGRVGRRKDDAARNLAVLLQVAHKRGMDPYEMRGSWAGAIGYPQFMPASLNLAADGDGDGKVDLMTFPDAIHSIARYLKENGYAKKGRRKAIWSYNHDKAYVDGVIAYADAVATGAAVVAAPGETPRAQP